MTNDPSFEREIDRSERFEFGDNWQRFLAVVDDRVIAEAQQSLQAMQGVDDLSGRSFLDAGSGSGLSSLVARRLGASVHSFDYDPQSVACTRELKRRHRPDDPSWRIERGSVLDTGYLASLGRYDVVYSWGVLHHTGSMWQAIDNVTRLVADGGCLHIAIYLTERSSPTWLKIKQRYNRASGPVKKGMLGGLAGWWVLRMLLRGENPLRVIPNYHVGRRGMSWIRDIEDWLGGLPYEHATPEEIVSFMAERGFTLRRHHGMEYVFDRDEASRPA